MDSIERRLPFLRTVVISKDRVMIGATRSVYRSEEHTSELQSLAYLVCRLLLEKKKCNLTIRKRLQRCKMRLKKRLLAFSRRLNARIRKTKHMHKMRTFLINRRRLLLASRLLWI